MGGCRIGRSPLDPRDLLTGNSLALVVFVSICLQMDGIPGIHESSCRGGFKGLGPFKKVKDPALGRQCRSWEHGGLRLRGQSGPYFESIHSTCPTVQPFPKRASTSPGLILGKQDGRSEERRGGMLQVSTSSPWRAMTRPSPSSIASPARRDRKPMDRSQLGPVFFFFRCLDPRRKRAPPAFSWKLLRPSDFCVGTCKANGRDRGR